MAIQVTSLKSYVSWLNGGTERALFDTMWSPYMLLVISNNMPDVRQHSVARTQE